MERPREFSMPQGEKPAPPPPPPMRQVRGPFGVETEESKAATAEWQRQHYARMGEEPPPTSEVRFARKPAAYTPGQAFKLFHLVMTVFWIGMIYPTIVYWKSSIEYLVFISIYAIIVSHIEAWQTSRLERKEEKKEEG